MRNGCLVVLLVLALPALSPGQGLGDAAARERQKRQKAAPAPAKVYTDADLEKEKAGAGDEVVAAAEAAGSGGQAGGKPALEARPGVPPDPALEALEREREERKLLQAEWRIRFANAREQLALAEAACWREVVRTEFYQGIPVQMKVKEFVESEEFRQAKQALADLEEEFRRTGLPPGWAREP
jgi:hypothetical protein